MFECSCILTDNLVSLIPSKILPIHKGKKNIKGGTDKQ